MCAEGVQARSLEEAVLAKLSAQATQLHCYACHSELTVRARSPEQVVRLPPVLLVRVELFGAEDRLLHGAPCPEQLDFSAAAGEGAPQRLL